MLAVPVVTVCVVVVVLGTVVTVGGVVDSASCCLFISAPRSAVNLSSFSCRSCFSSGLSGGRPCFFLAKSLGLSLIN